MISSCQGRAVIEFLSRRVWGLDQLKKMHDIPGGQYGQDSRIMQQRLLKSMPICPQHEFSTRTRLEAPTVVEGSFQGLRV